MRRSSLVAVFIAVACLAIAGWALWTYDPDSDLERPAARTARTTTTTIALVRVPSEVGKDGSVATLDLESVGLKARVVLAPSVSIQLDNVIAQDPEQGTEVPKGTVVELTISSGPA